MNCKQAKKLHLTYWELSPARQRELDSHLQACPGCQASFNQIKDMVDLCRKSLVVQEKPDDLEHYFDRLSKRLVKLSWNQRLKVRILGAVGVINRSVWGPVPAYAVVAVVLIAAFAILPLSQNGSSVLRPVSAFRSRLVVEQFEPKGASSKNGMTFYTLAQNTVPTPAGTASAITTAR